MGHGKFNPPFVRRDPMLSQPTIKDAMRLLPDT